MKGTMKGLTEIRWHGRAGQGIVTASDLLAETALGEGKYFQSLPEFGAERQGAPIRAYTRISDAPIRLHCQITDPDVVVVTDATLMGAVNVTEGLKSGGVLIVNTSLSPAEVRSKLGYKKGRVCTLDATRIALDTIGRNIPNTPMIGALVKNYKVVKKETLVSSIKARMGARFSPKVVEANLNALERSFNEVKEG